MTNAMEALFNEWAKKEIESSPQYEEILKKYDKNFCEYIKVAEAVSEEQKRVFNSGSKTAVQLLMGGEQV